jgi:hypothetical protein
VVLFIYIGHERKHPRQTEVRRARREESGDDEHVILSPFYLVGIVFLYGTNYIVSYQSINLDYTVTLPGEFAMLFGKALYWVISLWCISATTPRIMFTTSLCVSLIMCIIPVSNTDFLVFGIFYGFFNGMLLNMVYQILSLSGTHHTAEKLPYLLVTSFCMGIGIAIGTAVTYNTQSYLSYIQLGLSFGSTLCFAAITCSNEIHVVIDIDYLLGPP